MCSTGETEKKSLDRLRVTGDFNSRSNGEPFVKNEKVLRINYTGRFCNLALVRSREYIADITVLYYVTRLCCGGRGTLYSNNKF